MDRDKNGFIDHVELYGAFKSNGIAITEKEVKKMIGKKFFNFLIKSTPLPILNPNIQIFFKILNFRTKWSKMKVYSLY
jgi:hypothetical protein